MRRSGNILLTWIALIWFTNAYSQTIWSEVKLDKSSVYVGEPVEVTITVYTSTWFTKGLDIGNIKVNGAFSVYFRPVSTSFSKNGKNYAGVQLIYHVFPYTEKDIVFPSLDITVESPPEGDFKGKNQVVKTTEKPIRVKPVPGGFDQGQWLVTTGLNVTDNWQGDLQHVKVGDVLAWRIERTALWTVSELIPPIAWDSIPGVSQYQARSNVENKKGKTSISATRTETMRFLFEKEGEIEIPEKVFTWYNPVQKKLYKRTLGKKVINVLPNPDLGVLESVRDSLQVMEESNQVQSEENSIMIFGLSPKQFAGIAMLSLVLIYILIKVLKYMITVVKEKHERYRNSEAWYFDQFKKSIGKDSREETLNKLYRWVDELVLPEPSLSYFAKSFGNDTLMSEVQPHADASQNDRWPLTISLKELEKARNRYINRNRANMHQQKDKWINPE